MNLDERDDYVQTRMEIWFKRILERHDAPMEDATGCLLTAVPEDIFSLIKTQAELAGEHLKDEALCRVIQVFFIIHSFMIRFVWILFIFILNGIETYYKEILLICLIVNYVL